MDFYDVARKLQNENIMLIGFSVEGLNIDSPHAKHNWTSFSSMFDDAVYCSDFIASVTNERLCEYESLVELC
jgi:hypothetical protein